MVRSRYKFGEDYYPHFMTQTVVGWQPIFAEPRFVEIVFDSWRFLQEHRSIRILGYVVMENHLHWVACGPELGKRVGQSKSFIARTIIDTMQGGVWSGMLSELHRLKFARKFDQEYQLWQEGSHPEQLTSDDMLWQKIDYMHNNPLRRGYIKDPTHWLYSSARNYAQLPAKIPIDTRWY